MTHRTASYVAAAVGVVVLCGACKKRDAGAVDSTMSMMTRTDSALIDTARTMPPAEPVTDAAIFAMLSEANTGEIDAGKMAEDKATNASVKAFARDMVAAHSKMLNDGDALAKRLNIVPKPMAADTLRRSNQQLSDRLTSAAKGMTFDTAYINAQVAGHQAVLDLVKRSTDQAQNAALKKFLEGAQPPIEQHLQHATDIQKKLS